MVAHPVTHVRSSRKRCDISKCLAALAGFGRHPDSSERALKEVRHAVQVCVRAKFSLFPCPGQHVHERPSLDPCRTTCDTSYIGISPTEFTDCVEPHASFCAGQVPSFSESRERPLNGGEGRARPIQLYVDGVNTLSVVHL